MKFVMAGLDHKRSVLSVREKFAVTKEMSRKILADLKDAGANGCVLLSTCNRMELYASIPGAVFPAFSKTVCAAFGINFDEYGYCITEREGEHVMEHLCRVASGLDSQIMGDDQIITQVREALEFSRGENYTDSYMETMFKLSIHAAKVIKTKVIVNTLGASSVAEKAVEKIKSMCGLAGKNAVVIGNGKVGRRVAELLIREKARVTVTLRSRKGGSVKIPDWAGSVQYDERYRIIEKSDIAVSATSSPHITISRNEMGALKRMPGIIADLAVPRDVDPSIKNFPNVTLMTIDDITGETPHLSPESVSVIDSVIAEHIDRYRQWFSFKMCNTRAEGNAV